MPHVGWDQVHMTPAGAADPLLAGFAEGANMYFTHSYAVAGLSLIHIFTEDWSRLISGIKNTLGVCL